MSNLKKNIQSKGRIILEKLRSQIEIIKQTEHLFMIISAVVIGIVGGYGAVGFRWLIEYISQLAFPGEMAFMDRVMMMPWYWVMLIPAIGGLFVGPIIYFFAPDAKGHGVPEVMQAIIQRKGVIRPRVAFIKTLTSSITMGTGGSVGPEGPIIQIGAAIGSYFGQLLHIPPNRMKTLVGCGAAAGISAAFNAPIGGVLFALEVIIMEFTSAQLTPIVIASVLATVVSHTFSGDIAAFQIIGSFDLVSSWEIFFYFPLGALCGLISWMFIKALYYSEDFWKTKIKIPPYLKPAIGGLIVGAIAIYFPQIMSEGFKSISSSMDNTLTQLTDITFLQQHIWLFALVLLLLKIFATSITLGSGGSGGVLAPALYLGAMAGVFYGFFVHAGFPTTTSTPGMYALIAMAGLVAGTVRAPLTSIILIFELTKQISIILPLMITTMLSMVISSKLSRESIYTLKLLKNNINIEGKADVNILKTLDIKDIFIKDYISILENTNFSDMIEILLTKNAHYLSINSLEGKFIGIVSLDTVKSLIYEKDELKFLMLAGDTAEQNIPRITVDNNASDAIGLMNKYNFDTLPVMDNKNPDVQIGIIRHRDIDDAYFKEIERLDITYDMAAKIADSQIDKDVQIYGGFGLSEIKAPQEFVGKSMKDLQIRNKYNVDVISIKSNSISSEIKTIPSADYIFNEDDNLIVCGKVHDINILKGQT